MNIIRDKNQDGSEIPAMSMVPLLISWEIKRCNVVDCQASPTTIISQVPGIPVLGMCESHYKLAEAQQKFSYKLEF